MLDRLPDLVNANAGLVRRGRFVNTTFLIGIDDADYLVRITGGRVAGITPGPFITPYYSFALRASLDSWQQFWQPLPPLGFTDIFALVKNKLMRIEGDLHPLMANLLYFKDVLASLRQEAQR
jgi:hypothetical protein